MNNSGKQFRHRLLISITALVLACTAPLTAAASHGEVVEEVSILVNGTRVELEEPARMLEGRLFLPIAQIASLFGASVGWDGEKEAAIITTAAGDTIMLRDGVPTVYVNETRYILEQAPFLANGKMHVPIRYAASLLQASASWDDEQRIAELTAKESADEAITAALTEAEPYTEEEFMLLAKLTQVEAGYESYEGQLAVANVILNRVKSSKFPDTIRDVIYSGKQFPPAHNGLLDKAKPNESVLRAVQDALDGKNNIEDAVYFHNPKVDGGSYWKKLQVVATIGNHRFSK